MKKTIAVAVVGLGIFTSAMLGQNRQYSQRHSCVMLNPILGVQEADGYYNLTVGWLKFSKSAPHSIKTGENFCDAIETLMDEGYVPMGQGVWNAGFVFIR